jgi:hypothetical protein
MSQIVLAVGAALLAYFALRVVQIKRRSMPFLIAYPLFVAILVGGGLVTFIVLAHVAAAFGYNGEDPVALAGILGGTGFCLLFLWWAARRAIG